MQALFNYNFKTVHGVNYGVTEQGRTSPANYVNMYVNTGLLDALISLINGSHKQQTKDAKADPEGSGLAQAGRDMSSNSSQQHQPKEVSRYTLVVPTLRDSSQGEDMLCCSRSKHTDTVTT
jgi:hypothetical protein